MIIKSKIQNSKSKKISKFEISKFNFYLLFVVCYLLFLAVPSYAKDITVIYSGDTHAMIYPCSCPLEPDGGVARRVSLIKELKNKYADAIILDTGSFFGGGLLDENTQNTQLDIARSKINVKALELAGFDAVAISDDEFNFGNDVIKETINNTNLKFLSCNIQFAGVLPFVIKEVSGVKVGVIAVTNSLIKKKASNVEFKEPKDAVIQALGQARKEGASLTIILSNLTEAENLGLINNVSGIDILIESRNRQKEKSLKIGNTLILRTSWQGRRLGLAKISIKDNKVSSYKAEDIRLSTKVPDDKKMLSLLPRCFADSNCKKQGFSGLCQDPGSLRARCLYGEVNKINLSIITSKDCVTCDPEPIVNSLKNLFPGLSVSYLYHPNNKVNKLLKDYNILALPAYLLGKEVGQEKDFDKIRTNLIEKKDIYLLKPEVSGVTYFINRPRIKGKLDIFISLYDKSTAALLGVIKDFNPYIHFLVIKELGKFSTPQGEPEVEEDLRAVCIQKYYPQRFWDYLTCRAKDINSSWWDDCLGPLDSAKVKACARGAEGAKLLEESVALNKDLKIMFGPTYLMDNTEIFATKDAPSKEELKKILGK